MEKEIIVNPTCIVWREPDFAAITPHPDSDKWHASIPLELKDGVFIFPSITLPATSAIPV